jgi:hypothetical protein
MPRLQRRHSVEEQQQRVEQLKKERGWSSYPADWYIEDKELEGQEPNHKKYEVALEEAKRRADEQAKRIDEEAKRANAAVARVAELEALLAKHS